MAAGLRVGHAGRFAQVGLLGTGVGADPDHLHFSDLARCSDDDPHHGAREKVRAAELAGQVDAGVTGADGVRRERAPRPLQVSRTSDRAGRSLTLNARMTV